MLTREARRPSCLARQEAHFGNADDALAAVREVLTIDASNVNALLMLVDLTIERGEFEKARSTLQVLPRNPEMDALRLHLQGRILMAESKWQDAAKQLLVAHRFLAESPGMIERTDMALTSCFRKLGDQKSQAAAYRRVLKANPVSMSARLGFGGDLRRQRANA